MALPANDSASSSSMGNVFLCSVYHWMTIGLVITAIAAYSVIFIPAVAKIVFSSPKVFLGLIICDFGLVLVLSGAVHKMNPWLASALFILYQFARKAPAFRPGMDSADGAVVL